MCDRVKRENFQTRYFLNGSKFIEGKDNAGTLVTKTKIHDGYFLNGKL